jgi:hypothetical protein
MKREWPFSESHDGSVFVEPSWSFIRSLAEWPRAIVYRGTRGQVSGPVYCGRCAAARADELEGRPIVVYSPSAARHHDGRCDGCGRRHGLREKR